MATQQFLVFIYYSQVNHTNFVARDNIFVRSPPLPRRTEGIGTVILLPRGFPLSSTKTMLLVSILGTLGFCFCLRPTIYARFISPLTVTKTLSPRKPICRRQLEIKCFKYTCLTLDKHVLITVYCKDSL